MNENDKAQAQQTLKEKWGAQMAHIPGWGTDANPRNDPTYPMRRRFAEDRAGFTWERPPQQPGYENILHSNERPDVTRVFGTSAPLSGVSGMIRRCAFHYSEGRFAHWALLLVADRVNMLEGFASDLRRGHVTHCVTDRGLKAKWQYDRSAVIAKGALCTTMIGVLAMVCFRRHLLPRKHSVVPSELVRRCRHIWHKWPTWL